MYDFEARDRKLDRLYKQIDRLEERLKEMRSEHWEGVLVCLYQEVQLVQEEYYLPSWHPEEDY